MKKARFAPLFLALIFTLSACGEKPASFSPATDSSILLEAEGAFSAPLTPIDRSTACALYGIDENTVTDCAVYGSTTSAEELAILVFSSNEEAKTAQTLLQYRIKDRTDELRDYLPDELPKLEKAVIELRESSILFVIAADYGPVEDFLKG